MKSMRDMIKLMENVMAVPGVGNIGGSESDMQTAGTIGRNASYAEFDSAQGQATEESSGNYGNFTVKTSTGEWAVYGPSDMSAMQAHLSKQHGGAGAGMYGKIIDMTPYTGPVEPTRDPKSNRSFVDENIPAVDYCKQTNPASADIACAMEEDMSEYDLNFIASGIKSMYPYATSEEELKAMVAGETGYGSNPDFDRAFEEELDKFLIMNNTSDGEMSGPDDFSDDADALASAGHGSDEDYGGDDFPMEEAFDMQNGYDDIDTASGNDFFPNGADSPVITNVGPSGARQGDNPEQKKMQVAETHKELVYAYRKFLSESSNVAK